ncbi:hypothetical protein BH11PLA2_BH11PLA2_29300 [soil metagenome]
MNATTKSLARRLITCREAGEMLSLSADTIRRWYHDGKIEGVTYPTNAVRVYGDAVASLAKGGVK